MSLQYQILHMPTGNRHVGVFNASQSWKFVNPDHQTPITLEVEKLRLINTWNRQQPTEWKYWI